MTLSEFEELTLGRTLLDELAAEVGKQEGQLSGGTRVPLAPGSLQPLLETRLELGNPRDRLVRLTPKLFEEVGLALSPIQRQQIASAYAFYFLAVPVNIVPAEGARFSQLRCEVVFGPKGKGEPIVQSVIPEAKWEPLVKMGVDVDLGLDADLAAHFGVDVPAGAVGLPVDGQIQAHVTSKDQLKAFVAVRNLKFVFGTDAIIASGVGNSFAHWRLKTAGSLRKQDTHFAVVFKVPQGVTSLDLSALAVVEPNLGWLRGRLARYAGSLSAGLRHLLELDDSQRTAGQRLPKGDAERWSIELPQE